MCSYACPHSSVTLAETDDISLGKYGPFPGGVWVAVSWNAKLSGSISGELGSGYKLGKSWYLTKYFHIQCGLNFVAEVIPNVAWPYRIWVSNHNNH